LLLERLYDLLFATIVSIVCAVIIRPLHVRS